MKSRLLFFLILISGYAYAQIPDMDPFALRREDFMKKMQPGSVAIFPSKPVYLRNLDVEYEYRQESNLYYLTGFEEPEAILVLHPSHPKYRHILYVRERNPARETYDGPRYGTSGAMKVFRADTALSVNNFKNTIRQFVGHDKPIFYSFGINPAIDDQMRELVIEKRASGNWPVIDPAPIIAEMRLIKTDADFSLGLQRAIDISANAHIEAMKSIEPGMYEYEIQAVFEYVFRKEGSPRNGFPCIVGSGPNTGILHYNVNRRKMEDGDLVLMDCAAEFGYYSSDITRTVPVNGRFTKEQREVYQIVLDAQQAAIGMVRPGLVRRDLEAVIDSTLGSGLVRLGLLKDRKDFKIFTLHGYAHWIGLEVHDVGAYLVDGQSRALQTGMVFTIEPGIYVRPDVIEKMKDRGYTKADLDRIRPVVERYLNIGVRIEDNILVTDSGYKNLTATVPREISDIESLMQHKGIGNIHTH